jgi:hypothetical protein
MKRNSLFLFLSAKYFTVLPPLPAARRYVFNVLMYLYQPRDKKNSLNRELLCTLHYDFLIILVKHFLLWCRIFDKVGTK